MCVGILLAMLLCICIIIEQKKGPDSSKSVRHSLENVYHLMLMIWCRESRALHQFGMAGGKDNNREKQIKQCNASSLLTTPEAFISHLSCHISELHCLSRPC